MDIATLLRGLQLDLITWALWCHPDHCNFLLVDFAISLTRRRRDHRCDSSSSCDPIASVTDLVSAGATGHRGTESHTLPVEVFRAISIQKNRPLCCQNVSQQVFGAHDASASDACRCPKGRNRRAATSDDRGSKETSHLVSRSVLEYPSVFLI